uniref:Uncharacterized protein n=1 Tax=Octopus bimaculoides TaxID=37653 RepID=A0A0L8GP83_OCTBM
MKLVNDLLRVISSSNDEGEREAGPVTLGRSQRKRRFPHQVDGRL